MDRIVCYCVVFYLVQVYGLEDLECTEPQILLTRTFCDESNASALTMQTFTKQKLNEIVHKGYVLANDGCLIEEFKMADDVNNTFYIECEVDEVDCLDDEEIAEDENLKTVFALECEDFHTVNYSKKHVKHSEMVYKTGDKATDLKVILGSAVVAGLGSVAAGFAFYKIKTIMQSGTYVFPNMV